MGRRVGGDLYNFVRDLYNFVRDLDIYNCLKLAYFQFIKLEALVSEIEGLCIVL